MDWDYAHSGWGLLRTQHVDAATLRINHQNTCLNIVSNIKCRKGNCKYWYRAASRLLIENRKLTNRDSALLNEKLLEENCCLMHYAIRIDNKQMCSLRAHGMQRFISVYFSRSHSIREANKKYINGRAIHLEKTL